MKSFLKHRAVKQLTSLILAVMITAAFVPLPTRGATAKYNYKIVSLSQRKWVTAKQDSYNKKTNTYTYYLYKITVPANSFIRIDSNDRDSELNIYKSINKNKSIDNNHIFEALFENKLYRRVLPKGTYYIHTYSDIKWQYTTTKNPTNFCRTRSTRLKAGYKKTEIFNFRYEFDRWYRISLTAKKPINLTLVPMDENSFLDPFSSIYFAIYNSQGIKVSCKKLSGINFRTSALPKGTYYIRIYRSQTVHDETIGGRICQFWWR